MYTTPPRARHRPTTRHSLARSVRNTLHCLKRGVNLSLRVEAGETRTHDALLSRTERLVHKRRAVGTGARANPEISVEPRGDLARIGIADVEGDDPRAPKARMPYTTIPGTLANPRSKRSTSPATWAAIAAGAFCATYSTPAASPAKPCAFSVPASSASGMNDG